VVSSCRFCLTFIAGRNDWQMPTVPLEFFKAAGQWNTIDWFDRQQVASTCSRRIQVWDHFPNSASGSNESPKTLRSLVWLREDVEPTLTAWFHRSCLQQRWMALNQYHSQSNKLNATPNQWRVDQKPNYNCPSDYLGHRPFHWRCWWPGVCRKFEHVQVIVNQPISKYNWRTAWHTTDKSMRSIQV